MPNGVDKNLNRLAIACAAFRARHGKWPTEARVAPIVLWDYGQLLDPENFELLCRRIRLRSTTRAHLAVGNRSAHLVYDQLADHPDPDLTHQAWRWLGVRVRPELAHLE
jgi:hypothetical protein